AAPTSHTTNPALPEPTEPPRATQPAPHTPFLAAPTSHTTNPALPEPQGPQDPRAPGATPGGRRRGHSAGHSAASASASARDGCTIRLSTMSFTRRPLVTATASTEISS